MTLFSFSQSIKNLNREKKFSETLAFFKEHKTSFAREQIGLNKYIVFEMVSALIETNNYIGIFAFIQQYKVTFDPTNFSYLLKKFKDKPSVNWAAVNKFCDLISVDSLSLDCQRMEVVKKGESKSMELASDKENWYAFKTKALFETQQYQNCFELSKVALKSFEKFHYSNDSWFARRIALSKRRLGNSHDALKELLNILKKKKEWFIQSEIAEIYKENGDDENAYKYATDALNNFGDLEFKVGILFLTAVILDKKELKELSFKHYMLAKLLRQNEQWKIPGDLEMALQHSGYTQFTLEQLPPLIRELKSYWKSIKSTAEAKVNTNKQYITGTIERILHSDEKGIDGFIGYGDKESIYFRINPLDPVAKILKVKLKVTFQILQPKLVGGKVRAKITEVNK